MNRLDPVRQQQEAQALFTQYRERLAGFSAEQLAHEPSAVEQQGQIVRWQDKIEAIADDPDTSPATRDALYAELGVATFFRKMLLYGAESPVNGTHPPQ